MLIMTGSSIDCKITLFLFIVVLYGVLFGFNMGTWFLYWDIYTGMKFDSVTAWSDSSNIDKLPSNWIIVL